MTVQERKSIFAYCRELGMSEDDRHALIYSITGKESITELSDKETQQVIHELTERLKQKNRTRPTEKQTTKTYKPQVAGMITLAQQKLAWRLVYRLKELDTSPSSASAGERMAGAIRKELGITAAESGDIFKWVSFADGTKLIEKLKMYVRSAESRAKRDGRL